MNSLFGNTRNVVEERYALMTADSFVASHLPGWEKAACQILISPALGARFSQLLITLEREGQCAGNTGANQYFVFVLEGTATVLMESRKHRLEPGSYAYVPAGQDVQIASSAPAARLLIFQKEYQPLAGTPRPAGIVSHERDVKAQPYDTDSGVRVQALLPTIPSFDMAANILRADPGAGLPEVQSPVMERGWRVLSGQAIFRLGGDWHPVQAGDVVWTAPFCPQWFVGVGRTPASLICFQDVNRDPM